MTDTSSYRLRLIQTQDNPAMQAIIREVLIEMGILQSDYLGDAQSELHALSETYQQEGSAFWVLEEPDTERVLGGGGYARLAGTVPEDGICEIQKMYFSPDAQGKGLGKRLLTLILDTARAAGYRTAYLETLPEMAAAVSLYEKLGFIKRTSPLGDTGHACCNQFYEKRL
jgi:putative acetyltransferase